MIPAPPAEERQPVLKKYARLAGRYDARWRFYVQATARETVRRLTLRPNDRVLDVGCGTGALLQRLTHAYPLAQLSGVDPVPEMLEVARGRLPPSADLRQAWAERLPHEDAMFDAVISCNMFHYVREPVRALSEMGRVLRAGGQLVITDWCDDYFLCRVWDRCLRVVSRAYVKAYRETECLNLLREAGFPQARIERYKISWWWGLMTASAVKQDA